MIFATSTLAHVLSSPNIPKIPASGRISTPRGRCFSSLLTNAMTRSSASISLSPGRPSGPERQRPPTQSTKFRPVDRTSAIGLAAGPVGFWLGLLGQDVVERLLGFLAFRQQFLEVRTAQVAGRRDQV